jgi:hypothetical protein
MKSSIRVISALALLALAAGPFYIAFSFVRYLSAGSPTRVIVFPVDFVGKAVIVKDPVNGIDLHTRGFWHRETIIPIPSSGFLAVKDFAPLYWITREKVILGDGTLIDGTSPWGKYPSRFRYLGGPDRELEKKLSKYKEENNHLDCLVYVLASTPQFKNFIPKKDNAAEQGAAANP